MARAELLTVAVLLALAGCAAPTATTGVPPGVDLNNAVRFSTEAGGKFVSLVGPRRPHGEPFLGVPSTNYYALRSWVDTRSGETAYQLYVEDSYFGPERNWQKARLLGAQELRFIPIAKNEISCDQNCSYAEEFAAALPEALLRTKPQRLAVSFTGQSGAETTIIVPGEVIEKQLAATDQARTALPATTAATATTPPR